MALTSDVTPLSCQNIEPGHGDRATKSDVFLRHERPVGHRGETEDRTASAAEQSDRLVTWFSRRDTRTKPSSGGSRRRSLRFANRWESR
jgi:hypothetical protein